uniref:Tubulin-specific chaperone A n=1 Tax=Anopheles atroparvus TaxID=41427 RepID=A0A182JKI3_ANOAO
MAEEKRMMDKQRKRDNTVNSLLRLQSFARRYIPEQADEVPSRLEYLEKCWDTFQVIQDEYEAMDSTQELLQNNQDIREAMEELYLQTKSILIAASALLPSLV